MTYPQAKKLHNGDEILRKSDGRSLFVVATENNAEQKYVLITCDDGNDYLHTEIY